MKLIVFSLAGERFGVPADAVQEVVRSPAVRSLPGMPRHVAGVIRHRDAWIAVIDPAPVLGLPAATTRARALVSKRGRTHYALLVDAVEDVRTIDGLPDGGVLIEPDGVITLLEPDALFRAEAGEPEESETMSPAKTSEATSLVVFRVGGNELAIEVGSVLEVLPWQEPQPVPRAPGFVEGILSLRGAVVPIVDLRRRFEVPVAYDDETRILVIAVDEDRMGLVVDTVVEVLRLPGGAVQRAPKYFRGLEAQYMAGIAKQNDRLILVLRIDRVLTSEERIALEQADLGAEAAATE